MSVSASASQEVDARGLGLPTAAGTVPGTVHVGRFTHSLQQLCNCTPFRWLMARGPASQQMLTVCSVPLLTLLVVSFGADAKPAYPRIITWPPILVANNTRWFRVCQIHKTFVNVASLGDISYILARNNFAESGSVDVMM